MKIYAYLAAALLLAALLGYGTHVVRKAARVDAAEARATAAEQGRAADMVEVVKRLDADARQRGELLVRLDTIDRRFGDIKIPSPDKLIQSKEKPGEPCAVPSLGPEFFRLWNESSAATGSPEAATH